MKSVQKQIKEIRGERLVDTANTINHEGARAWKLTPEEAIDQLMMTGVLGSTFYVEERLQIEYAFVLIDGVAQYNKELLAKAIVKGRTQGFIRTAPILGLAVLSTYDIELFKSIFNDVIRTGNDMEDFISMCRAIGRGFGRGVKSAMEAWAAKNVNPFYALKYGNQIKDMVRLARFKTSNSIYDYIFGKDGAAALEEYPQLAGHEKAKALIAEGDWDAALSIIDANRLDPFSLTGISKPTKKAWKTLARQMGVMAYLKYLNKLIEEDAIEMDVLKSKITAANLKKARVLPYRLYIAYLMLSKNAGFGSVEVLNHLAATLDEYVKIADLEVFAGKKVVLAPDVSGSMLFRIRDSKGRYRSYVPADIAGMFTGILYKGTKDSIVLPWSSEIKTHSAPKADSVITHINAIRNSAGGGTYMHLPVDFLIKQKEECDVFVLMTDNEQWSNKWITSWIKYKNEVCRKAKAVLIRVDPYNSKPFSPELAKEYDITQVFGWSDNVLTFLNTALS